MRILLVEDDEKLAGYMGKGLLQAGHKVVHVTDGLSGLTLATDEKFDAAVFDLMLPQLDGLAAIDELRKRGNNLPVLILSAKREVNDRVKGLTLGADDYLTKPFAFSELLARLEAIYRRVHNISLPTELNVADLSVDLLSRSVKRNNQLLDLQPREFDLLLYLMRNEGRVVSKTMLMEQVWNYSFDPHTNIVETAVCRLREKIDRHANIKLIHTVRGAGYVFQQAA